MNRFSALGIMALIAACDGPAEFAIAPPIGAGGASSQSSSSAVGSASSSASSSGIFSMCLGGGVPCHVFSECCSGTCANNVCAKCASAEEKCADGCCVGLTCYDGKCGACKDDGQPCLAFDDCCSGVCTSGFCAPLICDVGMNACGNKCVEPLDHDNCLSCSNKCTTGAECCQSGCVDTANDASNCGACNVHCAWYKECKIGVCSNSPSCCNDGPNASHSPAEGDLIQPHGELVWPFTPSCNMKVKQIGVFTIGGWVGLAEDVQGETRERIGRQPIGRRSGSLVAVRQFRL